ATLFRSDDDRLRQQIGRDDPRQPLQPAQLSHDRGQCRRDDRRVQRREQHRQQQPAERDEYLPPSGRRGGCFRYGHGRSLPVVIPLPWAVAQCMRAARPDDRRPPSKTPIENIMKSLKTWVVACIVSASSPAFPLPLAAQDEPPPDGWTFRGEL